MITGSINCHCASDKSLGYGFRSLTHQPQQTAELRILASARAPHHRATAERLKSSRTAHYDARDWNHLAVVYDGFAKQARLYVNGMLQEISCSDTDDGQDDDTGCATPASWAGNTLAFKATKSFQVGRAKSDGTWGEYFPGLVDDVWAFQGALTDEQVQKLAFNWFDVPTEVPGTS
ncbi:hypothetical protein AB0L85_32830 [Streptomyces sp. NPDC052051]|uniref:hypothetical protein n=1 Tax=Streptomyces sp. NPDC052051 TaxID=3154649 RepID=UPI00343531A1